MSIRFLQPELSNWFLAIPLAFLCWLVHQIAKSSFRHRLAVGAPLRGVSRLTTPARDASILVAAAVALAMLTVAAMRPQLLLDLQTPQYERHDLILMLDRSASMHAKDIEPSRFDRALDEIGNFLARKPDTIERVALIGFAGTSLVLSQLTKDSDSLFFYLDYMRDDEQLYFDTNIGAALNSAIEVARKDTERRPKIYVVLSDGEDHGKTLRTALAALEQQRVRVHTIGIGGDSEVPIGIMQDGLPRALRNEKGEVMTTRYSPLTLSNIARLTGGQYYRSVTGRELMGAMQDIVSFEPRLVGWTASTEYRDVHRQALLLAVAAASFLLLKV